ncbi:MAG: hypothetical protein K2Q01_00080 [Rickettsiales bacterium]|nr:hypothetical protein [Rickettsiales bacterium]
MSENEDPESTIPWPGFVDILSTVIIVFVFFMMMTSVIIFVLSEQAKRAAVSEAQRQSKSEVNQQETKSSPEQTLSPDVSNLLMEKEALQKEINKLTQLKNVLSESVEQQAARKGNTLYIRFGDMGATITDKTGEQIRAQLPYEGHITITSYIPTGSDFASIREIALNRALNVRNVLLQNGVPSDHVALKILSQDIESVTASGTAINSSNAFFDTATGTATGANAAVTAEQVYGNVTLTFSE